MRETWRSLTAPWRALPARQRQIVTWATWILLLLIFPVVDKALKWGTLNDVTDVLVLVILALVIQEEPWAGLALLVYVAAAFALLLRVQRIGGETFNRLKRINPGVKVLLSSGYSINGQASQIMERGCDGFIQKPFNLQQVSVKVREILDKKKMPKISDA